MKFFKPLIMILLLLVGMMLGSARLIEERPLALRPSILPSILGPVGYGNCRYGYYGRYCHYSIV